MIVPRDPLTLPPDAGMTSPELRFCFVNIGSGLHACTAASPKGYCHRCSCLGSVLSIFETGSECFALCINIWVIHAHWEMSPARVLLFIA